jgi:hypothetical protein
MSVYQKALNQFPEAEKVIISRFWAIYQAELGKSRIKPDSVAQQAKRLNITPQALHERLERAANPKPRGRPKKTN